MKASGGSANCACRAAIAVCALALAAGAQAGQYMIEDLGDLGAGESRAYRINAGGQVVGWSSVWVGGYHLRHAFLYSGGQMHDLSETPGSLGHEFGEAWGINDAGQVVGKAENADSKTRAFLYSGGSMVEIDPAFGGSTSWAYAINNADQVAGVAPRKYTLMSYDHAFRWTDANDDNVVDAGEVLELLALDGNTTSKSYARDLNDVGQVVGYSRAGTYNHAFAFHDADGDGVVDAGELADLGTFGGNASEAYGINNAGQVVGRAQSAASKDHAFVWTDTTPNWQVDAGEMLDLHPYGFGGDLSGAHGINSQGNVVGYAQTAAGAIHAFIYGDGQMDDLNGLISPTSGWTLEEAWDINDSGQITGYGKNPSNLTHGFLLTPLLPGDADRDGDVDLADLSTLAFHWNILSGATWDMGDFDGDGDVDLADLSGLAFHWNQSVGSLPVPEPMTVSLLALGSMALIRRRQSPGGALTTMSS